MVKFKKTALSFVSVGLAACFSTSIAAVALANTNGKGGAPAAEAEAITRINSPSFDKRTADFLDGDIVTRLSDNIGSNQEISVILSLDTKSTLDAYLESGSKGEFSDYLGTASAKKTVKKNKAASDELKKALDKANISYKVGNSYEHVISGFEVLLRAKDYYKLSNAVRGKATPIVGEVYAPAQTEIVTNDVEVYPTGIFDSSSCKYQGDGVVVAVLDTGLDYTHTAFSVANFEAKAENDRFTLQTVTNAVNALDEEKKEPLLSAAKTTSNLKGEDVYVNRKVPYAYDYADKDPDVFPLSSEHGTHVAGVIAGKDDTITGVAPRAQLAIMKVFSDKESGARTSWILSALDDCVALGVDVINMSLGNAAGFTTQDDETRMEEVYDSIKRAGISLITAAGNEDNAVTGSDKNGSNPLTSNPDSGIVGSPSTFESALSVASVGGVKTPYFLYNGEIMYFTEAATSSAKNKNFVNDILGDKESQDFQYVTISGVGSRGDYTESRDYYKGKIVLVKRGQTTFEDKVNIALNVIGAAGIIIYNNVSGSISMQVGSSTGAVCSITQDQGEKLAANKTGTIRISKQQVAGPFMSDFSSWGPTSDLRIKPEITAHGGEILSAIPGQSYDRLSGTSMASPNMAGAAALIRQFVKDNTDIFGSLNAVEVTKRVNQLAMSTADIVRNKNGLAYAVRKQGAGLINITKATSAEAYISTFNEKGEMDKTKLELGDDKNKTGVYTMSFNINNLTNKSLSYNIGSIVMTEGVSTTYTGHGETTVTTEGYALNPKTEILDVEGGKKSGSNVTVDAKGNAKVTVRITLSAADKKYLNDSFEHGMYVEGFITLKAASGTKLDMNVPFLAFYGDWTEAPIFDEEYYDTNADELNKGIDDDDKLMADAYATRVIGGYYGDYIAPLGTYVFAQNPAAAPIAASKDHISLSNYEDGESSSLNKITAIAAGLLRNVKDWKLTITEDSTGSVVWTKEARNQRKSYTTGTTIYQSNMEVDFSVAEHNLKNNTKYTVTVEAFIDYGAKDEQNNVRNTFTFPLYIDFEAPIVTSVDYRTEYDQSTKRTRLYADLNIYDNHYTMAAQLGRIIAPKDDSVFQFTMDSFGKYMTPVYSSYNSTSKVTFELTDYVNLIKQSRGIKFVPVTAANPYGFVAVDNYNSFIATCYDYAMNVATYEIRLPDEVLYMNFDEETVKLSPNETLDLSTKLNIFPETTWAQALDFKVVAGVDANGKPVSNPSDIVDIVNQTVVAKRSGAGRTATVEVTGGTAENPVRARINITVRDGDDPDYRNYDPPMIYKAALTKYETVKAFYFLSSSERDIGLTGGTYFFGNEYNLSMYPSETVNLISDIQTYFPSSSKQTIKYTSRDSKIASVDEDGQIVALSKGSTFVSVSVEVRYRDGLVEKKITYPVGTVTITVKDPYTTNGMYLSSYRGLGGEVEIPDNRGFTTIQAYAFSGYDFEDKDLSKGDVIDDEDPYYSKQVYKGENETVTKVTIPEGVTTIEAYAFAGMTALETVELPSTLTTIGVGAFYGCHNLTTINLGNVKFINERAFMGCQIQGDKTNKELKLDKIIAIGSYAFGREEVGTTVIASNRFKTLNLPASVRSIDSGAFHGVTTLEEVTYHPQDVNWEDIELKLGEYVFAYCTNLKEISVNAVVIPAGAFYKCVSLNTVTLGKAVSVIGEQAFAGTGVRSFTLTADSSLTTTDGKYIYNKESGALVLVAPKLELENSVLKLPDTTTKVVSGAFAGNDSIVEVIGNNVTEIEPYAFADCTKLTTVSFSKLEKIGAYAFAGSAIEEISINDGATIGEFAFYNCQKLETVEIGDNVIIGTAAFLMVAENHTYAYTGTFDGNYYTEYDFEREEGDILKYYYYDLSKAVRTSLTSLTIGNNVTIGDNAFQNAAKLKEFSLGTGAKIGAYAFYDACSYSNDYVYSKYDIFDEDSPYAVTGLMIDLSGVKAIGEGAFSGSRVIDMWWANTVDGVRIYDYAFNWRKNSAGAWVPVSNVYSYYAPAFWDATYEYGVVDLSNVDTENLGKDALGEGVFAFNQNLIWVILPENLEEIPAYLFAQCFNLDLVENFNSDTITSIGDYAFFQCTSFGAAIESKGYLVGIPTNVTSVGAFAFANTTASLDFSGNFLEEVGDGAFGNSWLFAVTFADNAVIGDSSFYACSELGSYVGYGVEGLEKVKTIGAMAFAECPFLGPKIDLTGATEIGDFAFGFSGAMLSDGTIMSLSFITEVVLGDKLEKIGENPFFGCNIASFEKTEIVKVDEDKFPDLEVEVDIDTYFVNENKDIKVINNVLYKVVPNGLELVCYPAGAKATAYTVEENTVRIGARAFYGAPLVNVTLPRSLKAIGDQAFFLCESLTTVVFNSLEAPILEEEFDSSYVDYDSLPLYGQYDEYEGLGISNYYMWNAALYAPSYYFGANFLYYIGRITPDLVMVSPVNGTGYDSFIYGQYFGTSVEGSTAVMDSTLQVIEMIAKLNSGSNITLDDQAAVEAARRAYDALPNLDQKALVTNYSKLTSAESTIKYLLSLQNPDGPVTPPAKGDNDGSVNALGIAGFTVAGILLIALAAVTAYVVLGKKKAKTTESDSTETVNEDDTDNSSNE